MAVEARMLRQPSLDRGVLVRGGVVHHQMQIKVGGRALVDDAEEADELLMPVPLGAAADDGAIEHVQGGEQGRGAVPLVVVRHGACTTTLQRQPWLGAGAPGSGSSRPPPAPAPDRAGSST